MIRTGLLQKYGVREVSIAGYPEGHPDIKTDVLWRHLEDKSAELKEQGLDAVILTQFAFDTDPVMTWIKAVRERGIDSQIRVGTPGPAGIKRLLGFARRFGIGANAMIVKKYGFSLTNLMGTAGPDEFVSDLSSLLAEDPAAGRRPAALLHVRRTARDVRLGPRVHHAHSGEGRDHDAPQRGAARPRVPDRPGPDQPGHRGGGQRR